MMGMTGTATGTALSRTGAVAATLAGSRAGLAGKPISVCPYDTAGDREQRWLTRWWVKGYRSGRQASPRQ